MADAYAGKNILICGGSGMAGQSVMRKLLERGAHVRATQYQSRKITLKHKNLEIVQADLKDDAQARSVFKDMDIAFLCAAKVGGAKRIKEDPSGLIIYNLDLHAKLMYLAAQNKLEKCAFISSSYVYPHTGKPNVEEEGFQGDPPKPLNYGLGWIKRYLETLAKHFHITSGTKYAIIRPANMYGPYDNFNIEECHVIPALIVKAVNRMDPFEVWGNGQDIRCFTYIDDLAEGLLETTDKYAVAEALNICPKETNTVKDAVKIILEHLNFSPKVYFSADKPAMIPYKVSDPSKAKEALGWEAKISFREGLGRTIKWYQEQMKVATHAGR